MSTAVSTLKRAVKVAMCYALYGTGILHLWQRYAMRQRAVVLMYHRVLTPAERAQTGSHPALIVDRATFDRQMRLLTRRFRVLSLAEFSAHFDRRQPFPDSSCLITFDDGWLDNFANALPVLEHHRLPALIFLPMSYIGSERLFWPEALTNLLVQAVETARLDPERCAQLAALLEPYGLSGVLDTPAGDPRPAMVIAARSCATRARVEMEQLIDGLRRGLEPGALHTGRATDIDRFVTWRHVASMAERGIAFGGHGMDHHLLTCVPTKVVHAEIHGSRAALEARAITDVPTFSYPNGYWTDPIRQEVKAAGYRLAFGTKRGFVSCDDDRWTIRRLNVHEAMTASNAMFLARVVGLL